MNGRLIRDETIADDDWLTVEDTAAPVPPGGRVIAPLSRWRAERDALLATAAAVGVLLPNTEDVETIYPEIADRPLLALQFPNFGDGRALTQARLLRGRLGYTGELRAVGDILRDLVFGLRRCGFDTIVPRADQDLDDCLRALREFSTAYQPAADGVVAVFARRRAQT